MNIFFRVDAAQRIGTGHVMRCLTLADELSSKGHVCRFLTREHPGHLADLIRQRFHDVHLMAAPEFSDETADGYAQWLGADWETDAKESVSLLKGSKPDWLVVDHYAIDARWHKALRPFVDKVLVIDDLANRTLDCDALLNQNYGVTAADYRDLVKSDCRLLLGVDYALLRPEFASIRPIALENRRKYRGIRRILVSMGGTDPDNVTALVLEGLACVNWQVNPMVDIVLNSRASHLQQIYQIAQNHRLEVSVATDVNDIAERMLLADLAIGAAGSTTWERCCLGLPSLMIVIAENQKIAASTLNRQGIVCSLGDFSKLNAKDIGNALKRFENEENWFAFSEKSFGLVDGQGCSRVAKALI